MMLELDVAGRGTDVRGVGHSPRALHHEIGLDHVHVRGMADVHLKRR